MQPQEPGAQYNPSNPNNSPPPTGTASQPNQPPYTSPVVEAPTPPTSGQQRYYQNQYQQLPPTPKEVAGNKKKKLIIIGGAVTGALFVLSMTGLIFFSVGRSSAPEPGDPIMTSIEKEGPQPASQLDVERIQNSIGQDISGSSEDSDFSTEELSDRSLGL